MSATGSHTSSSADYAAIVDPSLVLAVMESCGCSEERAVSLLEVSSELLLQCQSYGFSDTVVAVTERR
jgi:hypothetical protein